MKKEINAFEYAPHIMEQLRSGGILATVGVMLFGMMPGAEQMKTIGTFMLCYLLGVAIAVAQATSGKIMQTLKGKE